MSLGEYLLGLLVLAGTWGAAGTAGWIAVVRLTPRLAGAPRVVAFATLGLAALVAVHFVPGALGIVSRWVSLALAVLLVVSAWRWLPRRAGAPEDDVPEAMADSGPVSWAIAGLAAALLSVWTVAKLWVNTGEPSRDIDSVTFHLPNVARWMQTDSLWGIHQFTPLLASGNYPNNGDLVYLSVVQPLRSDALVGFVSVPFTALTAVAVYCIARELRAPRASAALAGILFAAMPVVSLATHDGAKTDAILLAAFAAGLLFMLRHLRMGQTSDLVLGALGLGLAFGTKWYGVTGSTLAAVVWVGAFAIQRRGLRVAVRPALVIVGLLVAGGGYWLLRNIVQSGSPTFPVGLGPLWETPRDYIRECSGFRIVDYLTDGQIWADYILPAYDDNYSVAGAVLLAGILGAVALAVARRSRDDAAVWVLIVLAAALAVMYSITPYTAFGAEDEPVLVGANTRWLTPALLCCAALFAFTAGRMGRLRILAELAALAGVIDGVRGGFDLEARTIVAAAAGLVVLGAAVYGVLALRGRYPTRSRAIAATAAALALVMAIALGHVRQDRFHDNRYRLADDAVITYLVEQAPSGHRIALAGVWTGDGVSPVWPAFGPRIENRVEFLGEFVNGHLREYDDPARWRRALTRGRYDLLVVGSGGWGDCPTPLPGELSDDDAYAREAGLRLITRTHRLRLYQVPPEPGSTDLGGASRPDRRRHTRFPASIGAHPDGAPGITSGSAPEREASTDSGRSRLR